TALLDIAAMAQPQAVVMSPHNYNSPLIGMAATVHVSAVIPNFRITEYFVNFEDICREIAITGLTVNEGWIDLPTMPGLGIDIDVERLRAHAPGGNQARLPPVLGGIPAQGLCPAPIRDEDLRIVGRA